MRLTDCKSLQKKARTELNPKKNFNRFAPRKNEPPGKTFKEDRDSFSVSLSVRFLDVTICLVSVCLPVSLFLFPSPCPTTDVENLIGTK